MFETTLFIIGACFVGCILGACVVRADEWITDKIKNRYVGRFEKIR